MQDTEFPDSGLSPEHRARFRSLLGLPDRELPLARACLLIAAEVYPELDVDHYMTRLSEMSSAAGERIGSSGRGSGRQIEGLNRLLFEELKFHGNLHEYYDPENSYLNRVLERKTGIPITLSIVYLEVGWHLGIPLTGVGFPGHFLVRYEGEDGHLLIDPFGGGVIVSEEDCRTKLADLYGEGTQLRPQFLRSTSKRQILTRVLHNLKNIHLNAKDYGKALGVVDLLILLNPRAYGELRDRGMLHYQLDCYSAAIRDLQCYLEHCPRGKDAASVNKTLTRIRHQIH